MNFSFNTRRVCVDARGADFLSIYFLAIEGQRGTVTAEANAFKVREDIQEGFICKFENCIMY